MFHESYDPSNYQGISFPGLGLELNPDRVLQIGSFSIHYYGLIIAIGLALAVVYGLRRKKVFGLTEDDILDGALLIVPFAIICARAYYCAFSWDSFKDDPISVLYIWNGGLAIYGGVIGAAIGILVYCKVKKLSIGATLDLVALGFLIGQAIGRWGNFMNREAFGAPVSQDYFLAMGLFNRYLGEYQYFHPTFLYDHPCGMRLALWLSISFPRSGSMTDRSPLAMWPGTAWAGPSWKACGPTACGGVPSGSASCWRQ